MSLCAELAKKVPNIEEMSQFCEFTFDQIMMIRRVIESTLAQAERRKRIANYDPKTADAVKVLFAKIKPPELGHILKVPLELAEKLKENLQTTSNDPQEPSEVLEDLEATVDSREPAQIIEDILGKLQCIPTKIKYHSERARGCYRLLRKVDYFISVLDSWLKREKIIRQEEEDAKKEREENIIRQKEDAIKKKREDNIIRQKENATEKEIGDRAIRVDYGPAPPKEDFQSRGPRGGGGGSDSSKRLYVGNLSWNVDDQALESLFSEQGKVLEARVVYDRETGRSRGFGFITYGSTEDLNNALSSLNGADLDGRNIRVSVAEERPRRF